MIPPSQPHPRSSTADGLGLQTVSLMVLLVAPLLLLTACQKRSEIGRLVDTLIQTGKTGSRIVFNLPGQTQLPMRWVAPGSFLMGSPAGEPDRVEDEVQHEVHLTDGFFIAETELTHEQWAALMPRTRNPGPQGRMPVETVSWDDSRRFCQELTRLQKANGDLPDGWEWDLPTEAQWERACRGGAPGPFGGTLESVAWFSGNSDGKLHPVAQKTANPWGLHDMHGNVSEWCLDWFSAYSTNRNNWTNPIGPIWSFAPVIRGGSFQSKAADCRAAARAAGLPDEVPNASLGFRPVLRKRPF